MFLEEDMNAMPSDGGMQDDAAVTTPTGDEAEEKHDEETPATEEAAM